ncbi:cytochrome P450 [Aspergillus mulundensis]|uniref:Cytochrome P450 n=1 Tax=Aspergillus mulundensis TaxID=1810919 RepID=A0A3D8SW61_9EURO|nr:Uncharacterized protein DSM5745_02311 [Aspergillus mulundensis]RDW90536.1 Uncharacterized protein DSM5745_02311 [Aspergillus mulundensis]
MMTELSETPVLSQRAAYADMFGFKHTLNGHDSDEITTRKSRLFGRVLQVRGPAQFQELYPFLHRHLRTALDEDLTLGCLAYVYVSLMSPLLRRHHIHPVIFIQRKDPLPSDGHVVFRGNDGLIHAIITRRGAAMHLIQNTLIDAITGGMERLDEKPEITKLTLLHHLLDSTATDRTYWTPARLSQSILGLWLAASHQPWINLHAILIELCLRPEWQDALRDEALAHQAGDLASKINALPLLDSFMRETARVNSLDRVSIRRKALTDYTFSTRLLVPAGSTLAVSSYAVSRNATVYADPEAFDGRRFVNGCNGAQCKDPASRFADVSENHLIWGYGSLACPGRHHASFILKIVIVHIVTNYSLQLVDAEGPRWWAWEDFRMP